VPQLEVNLPPAQEDVPQMAVALIRAVMAAADQDQDEMTVLVVGGEPAAVIAPYGHERQPRQRRGWCSPTPGAAASG
jgi:hypothetical protein